jgi:hypothetical protein
MDAYTDHKKVLEAEIEKDIDLATILAHSTIAHLDPLVAADGCMNPHSIDFMPTKTMITKEPILTTCFQPSLNCDS